MALIHEKIIAILQEAGAVAKSEVNKDQGFNFRGVDSVTNAINPLLKKHGVAVLPTRVESKVERFENANKKIVTDAVTTVEYTWIAEDGSEFKTEVVGQGRDFADKAVAKSASVAFRTLLIQSLALPTDERDPDSESIEVTTAAAPIPKSNPVSDLQAKIKQWIADGHVVNEATGEIAELTSTQVNAVGQRISGAKDTSWKTDPKHLAATVAALEAGERK